jgi:hypothetical protein
LWSRHVDARQAGDRQAACLGAMRPVGLTVKRVKKKYGDGRGELMLIHQCVECGKISINRIAADDDPEQVLEVFTRSAQLDPETIAGLAAGEIELLGPEDAETVRTQLYGRGS